MLQHMQCGAGTPARVSRAAMVGANGASPYPDALSGYVVVNADSVDSAVRLAQGCPGLRAGGQVEVGEILEMSRATSATRRAPAVSPPNPIPAAGFRRASPDSPARSLESSALRPSWQKLDGRADSGRTTVTERYIAPTCPG